jgi:outer membrane protein
VRREVKGVAAKNDVLQAQTEWAKSKLLASRAMGEYQKSMATLNFSMGLPTNSPIILQEPTELAPHEGLKDLNAWLRDAELEHPAIKSARAQWESSKKRVSVVRATVLPTLDFVGNFYQNGFPNQGVQTTKSNTTTVGLTLSIPIFDGFTGLYKVRGAQAEAEKAQAQLEDTSHQILLEIVKSYADSESSLQNLESSQKLLDAANAALDSSVKRYDKGAADILELLNAQTALAQAQEEWITMASTICKYKALQDHGY